LVSTGAFTTCIGAPSMTISLVNGVNPLQTTLIELGIVSGRVALLLRSAEIQPVFGDLLPNGIRHSPPLLTPFLHLLPGGFGRGLMLTPRGAERRIPGRNPAMMLTSKGGRASHSGSKPGHDAHQQGGQSVAFRVETRP
jgi:hypothetical protein